MTASRARWTLGGDPRAEARVGADLAALAPAVAARVGGALRALVLVGGYARGEGAVRWPGGAPAPHNDYDLVVVVAGGAPRWRAPLAALSAAWTARLGVDVDLWPVDLARLASPPPTLFWLDVARGGARVLAGDPGALDGLRSLTARAVPLDEAGRLLANRAVGLALSNLAGAGEDAERLARHAHKAVLACGDARLLAADRYGPTLAARCAALDRLAAAPGVGAALAAGYRDAVAFRLGTDRWRPADGATPRAWYAATAARVAAWHLDFEAWRAGAPRAPRDFAAWRGRLYERLADVRPGAAPLAAVRAALRGRAPLAPWVGHPRERLARAAVALAYGGDDADARRAAAALLGARTDGEVAPRLRALAAEGG